MHPKYGNASLPQVRDYFGLTSTQFTQQWKALSDDEKSFFKAGVGEVLEIPFNINAG